MSSMFSKTSSETIVVDASGLSSPMLPVSRWKKVLPFVSVFCLVFAVVFEMFMGSSLSEDRTALVRQWYQLIEQKKTQQLNHESLQTLLAQKDDLDVEFAQFLQAVPEHPNSERFMSWIALLFEELKQEGYVEIPELISWKAVPPHDVKGTELEDAGITEFMFRFVGEYELLMSFIEQLRKSQRIVDIRSLRNLTLLDNGFVSVDLSLWSYHVPL